MWRTTRIGQRHSSIIKNFNPRPPCGGRPRYLCSSGGSFAFQSTSPVWRTTKRDNSSRQYLHHFNPRPPCGGRQISLSRSSNSSPFQSTSPVWRTTRSSPRIVLVTPISIHVPRVEDDFAGFSVVAVVLDFNPRPPCGGRLTSIYRRFMRGERISIHVPRVEDDRIPAGILTDVYNFNPRPPCGGRPADKRRNKMKI